MKSFLLVFALVLSNIIYAQTSDEVVQQFFTALSAKDVENLDRSTLDNMQLHSLAINDSVMLSQSSKEKFIQNIKLIPEDVKIEERIGDIKSVKSDYLAQFEVPYKFFVNATLSHSGVNVLTLLKTKGGWKISYIADTRNKLN
jgi:hypothetical protein